MKQRTYKICLAVDSLELGGVETYLMSLAGELVARGNDVRFAETKNVGGWSTEVRRNGFSVQTVEFRLFHSWIRHVRNVAKVLSYFDCIFINNSLASLAAAGLLPSRSVALPVVHLGLAPMVSPVAMCQSEFGAIVAVNRDLARSLVEDWGVCPTKVRVIENGVAIPKNAPSPSRYASGQPLKVVFVGRLNNWHKGILKIPDIWNNLRSSPTAIELTVVGDGPDGEALRRGFQVKCHKHKVKFAGAVSHSEVLECLRSQHVLLMPSNFEGMPIALLEAMAYGVIPIVSRLEGATDRVIQHQKNGFLINKLDILEFAASIDKLVGQYSVVHSMSVCAVETVKSNYTSKTMCQNYLDCVNKASASQRDSRSFIRSGKPCSSILPPFAQVPEFFAFFLRRALQGSRRMVRSSKVAM